MNDTGHHHHDAVNQPEPQWKRNASKNGGRVAKKKYHPKNVGTNAGNEKGRKP